MVEHGNTIAGFTGAVRAIAKRIQPVSGMDKSRSMGEDILTVLIEQDLVDETTLMLNNTTVKVHQHASEVKKGDITRKPDGAERA